MEQLEILKRSKYSKVIFTDNEIILYKKGKILTIPIGDIARVEYVKPSLLNYILAMPCFGGTYPGRIMVYLNKKIGKTKLYYIRIKQDEILGLPHFFKAGIGISNYTDLD